MIKKPLKSKSFNVNGNVVIFFLHEYSITYSVEFNDDEIFEGIKDDEFSTSTEAEINFNKYCNKYYAEMVVIMEMRTRFGVRSKKVDARFDYLNDMHVK